MTQEGQPLQCHAATSLVSCQTSCEQCCSYVFCAFQMGSYREVAAPFPNDTLCKGHTSTCIHTSCTLARILP